jgi:hypothetical protein
MVQEPPYVYQRVVECGTKSLAMSPSGQFGAAGVTTLVYLTEIKFRGKARVELGPMVQELPGLTAIIQNYVHLYAAPSHLGCMMIWAVWRGGRDDIGVSHRYQVPREGARGAGAHGAGASGFRRAGGDLHGRALCQVRGQGGGYRSHGEALA